MQNDQLSQIEARAKTIVATSPKFSDLQWGAIQTVALVARVRDLEQSLDQWQGSHENEVTKRGKAEARVKELSDERDDVARRLIILETGKYTALTERLKAAEAIFNRIDAEGGHGFALHDAIAAWRKVKGEPLPVHQPKTTDRCPDCGAYVGPKQGG